MAEPASTAVAGVLLVKYGVAIAGFAGAILSLTFLRGLTRGQAASAFFTGFASAIFTTPLAVSFFHITPDGGPQYGVAFLIGLLAMNIIPGLKALAAKFGTQGSIG
ncbi:peptidase M48, Ste24p [Pseudomonas sp. 10B1]|uniref:peptidase M48, Ste24p n=1 Tax=Pseudomonas sp. 10B1 TaxID=3048573 RepID=UPI002B229E33|nr:peptidase M48, Ste24p [Pseudomonas sp. 10B1]MEB0311523.1 peptidase M48, Ste24p [Pseudomonas sp. 10B1]